MANSVHDAAQLRAISHPLRLAILREMWDAGRPMRAADLAALLAEPANSVSYHIRKLRDAGFVIDVEGPEGATARDHWYAAPTRGITLESEDDDGAFNEAASSLMRSLYQQMATTDAAAQASGEGPLIHADGTIWLTDDVARQYVDRLSALMQEMRVAAWEAQEQAAPGTELTRYAVMGVVVPERLGDHRRTLPVEQVPEPPEEDRTAS